MSVDPTPLNGTTYLASKPRYEILDGLRGVAAILVVLFHTLETYNTSPVDQIINHGYLAVDFFYILSGFVIGYAYDDRWDRMTIWGFFKRRLVRLHPMVIMGTCIGFCLIFFGNDGFPMIGTTPAWKFWLAFLMCLFMIPCPVSLDLRGWGETNPFDGPCWSLTYEYLANIIYAFFFRFLPKWALMALLVPSAFFILDITLNLNVFKALTDDRNEAKYTVIGGWMITGEQIYIAMARLLYPFICGLVLYRTGLKLKVKHGFVVCSLMLTVLFCIPYLGKTNNIADGVYSAITILIFFPIIIMLGVGSSQNNHEGMISKICTFLGDFSYPLYITHYPVMYMQMGWVWTHRKAPLNNHLALNLGVLVYCFANAYFTWKIYDIPVRNWLTRRFLMQKKN
ncbi:Acyltransferase family protein [Trichomonas vaginalis G3]|uniref:Acyltransferase family protein n=1 Tax=Trichomonas vaginalis (strain ATCC PRA-98 / G3) TaxID=412133 RepID=A2ETN3_TRIV3|nr:acetyltransferase family [Trichomonas vaginalis G3]EAY04001.1 Acyltransferase family protein [Trichomonas vaginalis G3]KAI5534914.1 acetyltransferase family [Trichomonas vaginalis G3]|eukprot:XP_001316224.1 Acyltransferase family protein [Trichomonas vaginalis G3]